MGKDWVKLWTCLLDDPKIGSMETLIKWRAIETLLLAGEQDPSVQQGIDSYDGRLPPLEDIAWRLYRDRSPEAVSGIEEDFEQLVEHGWLAKDSDGYLVKNYWEWQRARTTAERVEAYRQRVKATPVQQDSNGDVTESYPEEIRGEERRKEKTIQPAEPIMDLIQELWGIKDMSKYVNRAQYTLYNQAVEEFGIDEVERWVRWAAGKGMATKRALQAALTALNKYGDRHPVDPYEDEQLMGKCPQCSTEVRRELIVDGQCDICRIKEASGGQVHD